MATIQIDNFRGPMTIYQFGNINSGRSNEQVCSGQNPFIKPGQLTFNQPAVQIDPGGSVITDMILAGKERVESGILYVYAIGHTGRLYKIQVNNPSTFTADYDNPVLLATLSINSPTFTRGGFIDFCGTPEQIFIGHDMGVTTIHFDGTTEAFLGSLGSWTQNIPRPLKQFIGKLYVSNGTNVAEVDISGTGTVNTYTKLSPGFPANTQIRDMDLNPEGTYLEFVVSRLPLFDITSATQDTTSTSNASSYIFKWNGTDTGYTSFTSFPTYALSANTMFQNYQYTFGTDQFGMAIFNPNEKIYTIAEATSPFPNAIISSGNLLMYMVPLFFKGVLELDLMAWGSYDFEIGHPLGNWDLFFMNATTPETDIVRVPYMMSVSNEGLGSSSNGYANNIFGTSKIYFSTLETSSAPTTKYRFYKWSILTTVNAPNTSASVGGIYQTQTQLFPGKITVSAVRIYGEPWLAGQSFQVDLIGQNGNPITNGTKVFTSGVNPGDGILQIGTDYCWWGPDMAPTYALGVAITTLGDMNFTINKIEIDYEGGGK